MNNNYYHPVVINEQNDYSNNQGQINKSGDNCTLNATNNMTSKRLIDCDIELLKEQLIILKNRLAEKENYVEASEIKRAIEEKDESKIMNFLKNAGEKAFEFAKITCLPIAEEAIKKALGLM